jgi:cytochrome c peroxidase
MALGLGYPGTISRMLRSFQSWALWFILSTSLVLAALLASCGNNKVKESELPVRPVGHPVQLHLPLGLPPLPVPDDNPETVEAIALGRKLFYDSHLSSGNTMSCATCHNPGMGFSDPRPLSVGAAGKFGTRNAPSVLNSAYSPLQFWDGRAPTLEEQAGGPMANPIEMNQPHEVSVAKLNAIPAYRKEFEAAYGPGPVTIGKIKMALASFERTLLSGDSPFDRYQYGGDKTALSPSAIRGLAIFTDTKRGNCATCHTIGDKYALFTDGKFHNIGVAVDDNGNLKDLGRFEVTHVETDKGKFRTPTLRNIAKTAPYMHDGSEKTLRNVVDFYVGGGNSNQYLDPQIHSLQLSATDKADLLAFLQSLTGTPIPLDAGPTSSDQ